VQPIQDTKQKPLNSGFGPTTTAVEALGGRNLAGKTAIVTGGYSGIGLETTRVLSEAGATVIVPARSPEKARTTLAALSRIELAALDLVEPASIDAFAEAFVAGGRPLHLLINNAGIMAAPLSRDSRGNESQFSANHLGHFQLTVRLWPALVQAKGARVVALSSRGHRFSGVDFDDPNFERRPYDKWKAYGQSKTANALFAVGLERRGQTHGVRAFAVHPGTITATDLSRHLTDEDVKASHLVRRPDGSLEPDPAYYRRVKTIPQGAATTIWCATSPQLDGLGGVYCEDCDIAEVIPGDFSLPTGVAPWACDPELADRLWKLSERLTRVQL
jgi:NAD(P)-dependent dehydrogenase (short-subunit alcohol dehydrogenase family)